MCIRDSSPVDAGSLRGRVKARWNRHSLQQTVHFSIAGNDTTELGCNDERAVRNVCFCQAPKLRQSRCTRPSFLAGARHRHPDARSNSQSEHQNSSDQNASTPSYLVPLCRCRCRWHRRRRNSLYPLEKFVRALPAVCRIGLDALHDRSRNLLRNFGAIDANVRRTGGEFIRDVCRSSRREHRAAGQHFECDHSERVNVHTMIDVLRRHELLGGHVRRSSYRHSMRSQLLVAIDLSECLADSEIDKQRVTISEQDVLRFDVTVHYLMTVRVRNRIDYIAPEANRFGNIEPAVCSQFMPCLLYTSP